MTLLWLFGFSKVKWLQLTGEVGKSITCWCQFSRTKSIKISQFLTESIKKLKVSLFETQCRWSVYCHIFRATISAQKALFIYCVWLLIEWLLIDRFSRFCTAHGRKSLYFTIGDPFPQNCPFLWGSGPHLIRDFLGQSEHAVQTASRSVQLFSHRWPQGVPDFTLAALSPKIVLSHGGSEPHLTHDFLGQCEPTTQTASRSVQQMTASIKSP